MDPKFSITLLFLFILFVCFLMMLVEIDIMSMLGIIARLNPNLKIMMFYDFDPKFLNGIANVISPDGASISDMVTAEANWKYKVSGLAGLPTTVFDRAHHGLHKGWSEAIDAFVVNTLTPGLHNGTFIGVFLGDEICCSGVPLSNLTSVLAKLRSSLAGQKCVLYTNECTPPIDRWDKIPHDLDLISVDFYDQHNTNGTAEVEQNRKYLLQKLYPKLHPHQGVILVPGIFASDPVHCREGNVSCPLDAQAEQIVIKLEGFFEWAKMDPKIHGFNPWHFNNRSTPQSPGWWDQRLGASSMPSVVSKLREVGQFIIENEKFGEWDKTIYVSIACFVISMLIILNCAKYRNKRTEDQKEAKTDRKYEVLAEEIHK